MTKLVVVHPAATSELDTPAWDAYIQDREPVRVSDMAELNEVLAGLNTRSTLLIGAEPCDSPGADPCPYAATVTVLSADEATYRVTRACGDHASIIPEDGFPLRWPAAIPAAAVYDTQSPADIAGLARALLAVTGVPPQMWQQPKCSLCHQRIAPATGDLANLTWVNAKGRRGCSRQPRHAPAPGAAAALITAHAAALRGLADVDDAQQAEIAS